ncbi:dihydrofolate reductase family protein [Nonomuraea sp. NBC_01738]|uniref:dihydrofolate reductase family protein n=1 Tax=Nonomuraea sp. NBC_01738 TaxID=2976003 RepID=UPI002E0E4480|nr:dihydrofolate reductase family protein [Nonomuraea sp. NBC_01738]
MRKLVYYVGLSIDGYIAGPGHEFDFYPVGEDMVAWMNERYPETVPVHVRTLVGMPVETPNVSFDTVLMGRGTYDVGGIVSPFAHMRQYVVSTTHGGIDDPSVELVKDDPIDLVRRLKAEESDKDVWLCGGGNLAASLLPEIDELVIKCYPVIAGDGIPAIRGGFLPTLFAPVDSRAFANGARVTWFSRA